MTPILRRRLVALAVLGGAAAAAAVAAAAMAPRRAAAQLAVACVNCSTVQNQLLEYAKQIESVRQQVTAYNLQIRQYANMIQNTVAWPQMVWGSLQADVAAVQGLLRQGQHLSLNSGFAVSQLGAYANYVGSITDMPAKYTLWSTQANDNIAAIMRGLGLQQDQFATDQATLQAAQARVQSADGQVRAIQALAGVTSSGVDELQKLRQAVLAQAQLTANIEAQAADRRAVADAQLTRFLDAQPAVMAGNPRY